MTQLFLASLILGASALYAAPYSYASSSFSSSASSIVTDSNGKVHSSATAEEAYSENDSSGLNRQGSGKYAEKDGKKVLESTKTCQDDECVTREQSAAKHNGVALSKDEVKDFERLFPL
jgi:hypothetical protein